ncbi:MAG: SCO family protein [Chloroflexi bacterium]|nr:SCO family protein [Chloroflexota bacterium]
MDKKILSVGLLSLLLVLLVTLAVFWLGQPASFRGTSYGEPYPPAAPFELTRADGQPFRLADQRGKIVLLFFGYTACPDVCPTTMAEMKQVVDALGDKAVSVQVVFISVDPDRDTPELMQKYADHFNKNFIGLSGSMDELQKIWDAYGIFRAVNQTEASAMGYIVDHTARVTLVDADGNLRLSYGFQTPVEDIVHDIKILLKK